MADGTITTAKLHDDAVTTVKIADDSITSAKIVDGTIVNADISASAAIAKSKLAALNITDSDISSGAAIDQSKVANLTADLSGKAATVHTHTALQISDSTATGRSLLAATDAAAARTAIGAGISNLALAGSGSATTAAHSDHTHSYTKSDVGLGNVDNTSDTSKPISSATQTALDGKADVSALTSGLAGKASTATTVTGTNSLTGGGDLTTNRTLSLVNDTATPGNSKYYGTNGSGTKGYYDLPVSGGSNITVGDHPSLQNIGQITTS